MSEYICELCPSKLTSEDMRVSFDYGQVREEIVRCKDCKHLIAHGAGCEYWNCCDIESVDGFCAWGEKVVEK